MRTHCHLVISHASIQAFSLIYRKCAHCKVADRHLAEDIDGDSQLGLCMVSNVVRTICSPGCMQIKPVENVLHAVSLFVPAKKGLVKRAQVSGSVF